MNSTHCPKCNEDIGVWPIYMAGLPNRLKCPHCKTDLEYQPSGWKMLLISLALAIPLFAAVIYFVRRNLLMELPVQLLISLSAMMVIWAPFEMFFAYKLRKEHQLVLRKPKKSSLMTD